MFSNLSSSDAKLPLITYSRNVFIPVTDLCRNRCGYCSFRQGPERAKIISPEETLQLLKQAALNGCTEALFSLGESPWIIHGFEALMAKAGRQDLVGYLVELCELALDYGLLPHTNAGILSEDALAMLAPYNASMGLMLETTAIVDAHKESPGKNPSLRLSFIANAGRLRIPFTTGILIGIGESPGDRLSSLKAIGDLHKRYGHIQEVIVQPFDPKPETAMAGFPRPSLSEICGAVHMAREVLPEDIAIQVAPNLFDPAPAIKAGANDLGGISPITPDWINPDRHWPKLDDLRRKLKGYDLRERLPIYPRYVMKGWQGSKTTGLVRELAGEDGLKRESISSKR
ncbi:MAG: 7,8-didemethyl-8-hydroxy-5-deazariboflavin synthase subunit CofG [Methanotrichaceae archaeon]